MENKFVDSVVEYYGEDVYTKLVSWQEEVKPEQIDAMFDQTIMFVSAKMNDVEKSMLTVQAREAVDEGYIRDLNSENDEDEEDSTFLLNAMGVELCFDVTEKGRAFFRPLVKAYVRKRIDKIIGDLELL